MKKQISIRNLAFKHVGVILIPILLISSVIFVLFFEYLLDKQELEHKAKAKLMAGNISQLISFYNEISHDLAKQLVVTDLINDHSKQNAEKWSKETKALLPHSNGLALLTEKLEVIGDRKKQKVGPLCMRDVLLSAKGELGGDFPPIHLPKGIKGHFDIVAPILRNEKTVGVLFASFSLDVIQQAVKRLQEQGEHLYIETGKQIKVASTGRSNPELGLYSAKILGTSWVLHIEQPRLKIEDLLLTFLFIFLIFTIIIITVTSLFAMRLGKIVVADIISIKENLKAVQNGEFENQHQKITKLTETRGVAEQVAQLANDLYEYQQRLIVLSSVDELTGINNRREFFNKYPSYQSMLQRGTDCALILFDLDFFKLSNDTYGHKFGDEILQTFSDILLNSIRGYDFCARFGGDEFVAVFSDCSEQDIKGRFKQIDKQLKEKNKHWKKSHQGFTPITVSAGAIVITQVEMTAEQVVEYADKALYRAKNLGRAQICFYTGEAEKK